LDLAIKTALFFRELQKRRCGRTMPAATDKFTQYFGSIVPSHIPDSTAWWRRQSKELAAICDEYECGLMQAMVTITLQLASEHLTADFCLNVVKRSTQAQQPKRRDTCGGETWAICKANADRAARVPIHSGVEEGQP